MNRKAMKTRYILAIVTSLLIGFVNVAAQTEQVYNDVKGTIAPFTVKSGYIVTLNITGDLTFSTPADPEKTPDITVESGGKLIINTEGNIIFSRAAVNLQNIRVQEGGELHIENVSSSPVKLINTAKSPDVGRDGLIMVYPGGIMTVDGGTAGLTFDGGAELVSTDPKLPIFTKNTERLFKFPMVMTYGTVTMNNVTFKNYCGNDDGGALGIIPLWKYYQKKCTCGQTILNNCTFENSQGGMGTAIHVGNYHNELETSVSAEDCKIEMNNCLIRNCEMTCTTSGAGAVRFKGTSVNNLYLRNTVFENNYAHGDGATIWWNAGGKSDTKCVIDGCQFIDNTAVGNAAGPNIEASFEFNGNKTIISGNHCGGNGAGVLMQNYRGAEGIVGGTLTFNLPSCLEVMNNTAGGNGGGIAFVFDKKQDNLKNGTTINTYFDGVLIHDNSAGGLGGGIYLANTTDPTKNHSFNIELNSGTIENNTSSNGGGIYIQDMKVTSDPDGSNSVFILNNKAVTNGTDTGNGGGIYLSSGNLDLQRTYILGNKALNGGGLYVHHGEFTSSEGSVISDNSCDEYGGGVFIYNENKNTNSTNDDKRDVITLTGGSISNNTAKYGGGLAAYGNLRIEMINTSIEANTAKIGGGVFTTGLDDGSKSGTIINYNSGLIRHNRATSTSKITTAYSTAYSSVSGVGGGFYIGPFSLLDFPSTGQTKQRQVGIYSNLADNAADDIFGYNYMVIVNLPNVSNLELSGYDGENITNLYWVEDYFTNDDNYDKGLKLGTTPNQRYRDVIEGDQGKVCSVNFGTNDVIQYTNKYLCLALGWHINRITLVKEGMKDGENAIFNIYKDGLLFMTVMLTDADKQSDGSRSKIIELNDGVYRIVETDWSWAYKTDESVIERTISIQSTDTDRIFTFYNTPDPSAPIHSEDLKINKLKIN